MLICLAKFNKHRKSDLKQFTYLQLSRIRKCVASVAIYAKLTEIIELNNCLIGWGFSDLQNNLGEEGVISRSRRLRLRLIALTETLVILNMTKTHFNNCFIIYWTKKKMEDMFLLLRQARQSAKLNLITLRNHAPRSCITWLPLTLHCKCTWHDHCIIYSRWHHRCWFSKIHCMLLANQERVQ